MKQVLIIRTKFPGLNGIRKGKLVAQGAHASVTATLKGLSKPQSKQSVNKWISMGQKKIAVYVETEEQLLELWQDIQKTKIPCSLVKDAGTTEFGGVPTFTAIGFGPAEDSLIDQITKTLPLL